MNTDEPNLPEESAEPSPSNAGFPADRPVESQPIEPPQPASAPTPVPEPAPDVPPVNNDADEAQADEYPQEGPAPEAPEVMADFTPHTNVSFDQKIIEPQTGAKTTEIPLELVNIDLSDLSAIRRDFYNRIGKSQVGRRQVVEGSPDTHPFTPIKLDTMTVWITESEFKLLEHLQYSSPMIRRAAGDKLFENDPESQWTNLPKRGDSVIAISNLSGENSPNRLQRMRAEAGMSIEAPVPLWNSGLHIRIRSQGAMDGLQLQTKMAVEKLDEARESSGYTYSAPAVFLNRLISTFILDHVTSTSVGSVVPNELLKLIKITDLDTMSLGAAAANHPKGYPMTRSCITSKGGCGHVVEGLIQPRRMLMVRHSRINDNQWAHMNKKTQRVDIQTVKDYQASLRPEINRLVHVSRKAYLRLSVPSLYRFDRLAGSWMTSLSDTARQLVPSNANEAEREMFLYRATSISQLLSYLPWVEAIVEYDPTSPDDPIDAVTREGHENDPEAERQADLDIESFLRDVAADPEMVAKIAQSIADFIDAMTLSVAVVEKAPCPVCQKPLFGDETSKHKHAVQINPIELFFTLNHLRIERASAL